MQIIRRKMQRHSDPKYVLHLLPIIGQKRIIHHFSKKHAICEKFYPGYTLWCQNKDILGIYFHSNEQWGLINSYAITTRMKKLQKYMNFLSEKNKKLHEYDARK